MRDSRKRFLHGVCLWLAAICFSPVHAGSIYDFITSPIEDPLSAAPDILKQGSMLPGDATPAPCPAVKDFADPLALWEAIDLALCSNPQIKSAWAEIKMQSAAVGEARAAYLPTLSGTAGRLRDITTFPGSDFRSSGVTSTIVSGTVGWRIFDFGGRDANRKSANQLLLAAIEDHDAVLQKTLASVIGAYFDAQTSQALLLAKKQSELLAQHTLETSRRRETKGADARSDVLQASTALAKVALERSRAEGAYLKSLSVLTYAIGAPSDTKIVLADDLEEKSNENNVELKNWLDLAASRHPAILAARAKVESAEQQVISARSDGLPTFDFSGNMYQNGRQGQTLQATKSREWVVGVTMTIPIFDGFSRTYKISGAEAQAEQKRAELEDIEHQTLMNVVKAYADAGSALNNLDYSQSLLSAAQESLATTQRKFEKGASDILDILNAQGALADAQQQRIQCLAEWRSARLQLLAATGQLDRAEIRN